MDGSKDLRLSEVFGVYPVNATDIPPQFAQIAPNDSFSVELYNFALNLTSMALVDTLHSKVLDIRHLPQTQPNIPPHLKDLAIQIAIHAPEVAEALGFSPTKDSALMASTKTSLNHTRCERSRHLCVAPTFVVGKKALWVIVDLTELTIAGIRWTNVGATGPSIFTERKVQDDTITEKFCERLTTLERDGWKMDYHLTTSDGLEVLSANYMGAEILKSAKLVDWHVSYSHTDGFGYSDAVGCPFFSQAAVIATQPPVVSDILDSQGATIGFRLSQQYFNQNWPEPCNYNYEQKFEFYKDGQFRVAGASIGRGCGNDGIYRPVFRIAFTDSKNFSEFDGKNWIQWGKENWVLQTEMTLYNQLGAQFQIEAGTQKYFLVPSRGQFDDGGRGDFAYTYLTKSKPEEGEQNLQTIGPCCNNDYRQGPERFIESPPEPIADGNFVVWYVPQLRNDNRKGKEYCWAESELVNGVYEAKTYPCFAGPLFVPAKS